jgi:MarR family transcriptional regulator, organic hydroperoxide resistance regulator
MSDTAIREQVATKPTTTQDRAELLRQTVRQMMVGLRMMKLVTKQLTADVPREVAQMGEGQYHAVHALFEHERLKAGELAERCHVSEPTISKMLKGLEHGGLVERQTDPENRRIVWVSLTPRGRALHDKMATHFESALVRVMDGLSDDQLRDLIAAFGHLARLVEGDERRRPPKTRDEPPHERGTTRD